MRRSSSFLSLLSLSTHSSRASGFLASLIACLFVIASPLWAQSAPALVTQAVDNSVRTVLTGNIHPMARAEFDQGEAPPDLPLHRMLLVLKRSPEQETALRKLLDDQQDKGSASYHKWLTPEEVGQQFGPTDADMQIVVGWLQSHGFQVGTTKGRTLLEFSGSASQVQEAFHTTIHKYIVDGEQHWANDRDPSIPTALTPAVAGVLTLHNFLKKPHYILGKEKGGITPGKPPQITFTDGSHGVAPGDYAVIYNITPVYNMPINGSGITIGVVARSEIQISDYTDFQNLLQFSSNVPSITLNGPDPGDVPGDDIEGTLDATWSQAIAPGATVDFVVSATTDTTDGVDLSVLYIIENNLANIMTESFGSCEALNGDAQVAGTLFLAEQAAAQGITYMAGSGDAGAEGCDSPYFETVATGPISVSLPASTPFTVAVGGTVFNENGNDSKYWSASNSTGGSGMYSALSYIPEDVWNDSCLASSCGANANIAAGGGGESTGNTINGGTFTGFSKPSWQAGVTGIPTTNARYLPDVSLTAAGHDGYLLCFQGSCAGGSVYVISGTSASAPSFAGIMALVDQKMGQVIGANGARQGQADYVLYPLAAAGNSNLSKCNGSSTTTTPANTCAFNDITVGNNEVPGEPGYPSAPYNSTVGYDPASGLGSVDVNNLVTNWSKATFKATTTTLTLGPPTTNIAHGTPVNVTIGVTAGTGTPTGDVSLIVSNSSNISGQNGVDGFTLTSSGTFTGTTTQLPGGSYNVWAHYAGIYTTAFFAGSDSNQVAVTVTPEGSQTTLAADTFDASLNLVPIGSGSTLQYGELVYLHAAVLPGANGTSVGIPTGTVSILDNATAVPGSPFTLSSDGSASTPTGLFNLPAGSQSITAAYSSDTSFNASTSTPFNFTIAPAATSLTVTPSQTTIPSGGTETLTAKFTLGNTSIAPPLGNAPTGTVTFYSNGTSLGNATVTGTAGSGNILAFQFVWATATASLTTTAGQLPDGADTITAIYNGDGNYAKSPTSAGVVVNVGGTPDFSLPTGGLGTVTITSPGGQGTVSLSITPTNGFSAAVTFTCVATSLPAETTCGAGTIAAGSTTGTMSVQTTGPHQIAFSRAQRQNYVAWVAMSSGLAFGGVFLVGGRRRRRWTALMSLIVLALLITLPACGGGSSTHTDPGTPPGTYTVNVTATSGSLSHNTSFMLVVQ